MSDAPHALPLPARDERWALFLDFDGTLVELAETPDAVHVPPALPGQLAALAQALDGALAIVSGRGLDTIDAFLDPLKTAAAGLHGMERRDARGDVHRIAADQRALDEARRVLARFPVAHPACLLEDKRESLALHYRRDPSAEPLAREAAEKALAAAGDGFHLQTGHRVLEIKSRSADKGAAIHAFMDEPPFAGRRPVFVGDDDTDEHGFRVVREHGGIGLRVGKQRSDSAAHQQIAEPAAVHAWLAALLQRCQ